MIKMQGNKRSIVIASLGTLIEYYDYSIFSLFLPFIAPVFFPGKSDYQALVVGFYAILIAAMARPVGGFVFGHIGDRYGRKTALLISIYGIALATLTFGFLPGFVTIGIIASLLVIVIRSVQMLCYGGEYSGAGIYVVEIARPKFAGFIGSLPSAMALTGSAFASIVGLFLTCLNSKAPNWRLGFIFGGIVGLAAVYFRRGMIESVSQQRLNVQLNFTDIFRHYPMQILAGFCVGGATTVPFTTLMSFVNPLFMSTHFLTPPQFMWLQLGISVTAVITLLCAGFLADQSSPLKVMLYASLSVILLAYPLAMMMNSRIIHFVVIGEFVLIIINEILFGPSNAYLKKLFPTNCRYRGVAFSFCVGMSIFGGLTPVVENWLMQVTGNIISISYWLASVMLLNLIVLFITKPVE